MQQKRYDKLKKESKYISRLGFFFFLFGIAVTHENIIKMSPEGARFFFLLGKVSKAIGIIFLLNYLGLRTCIWKHRCTCCPRHKRCEHGK